MTERERAAEALEAEGAFEADGEAFVTRTAAVEARVTLVETTDGTAVSVVARVPTIDAVVVGETVAPVVAEGWLETFERRLEDVGGAVRGTVVDCTATTEGDELVVETTLRPVTPGEAAAEARAVVEYVEGTFVEGLIPGYEYRAPAAELLARARSVGDG